MNGEVPYRAVEYGDGNSNEAVALVAGLDGNSKDLEQAACDLADTGRDAVVYTHHPRILLAGEAQLLPKFIDTLSADFIERTADHERHRFGGVSLGGAIAAGMQRNYEAYENPERGLYGATGIDAAELVMKNCLFRAVVMATHRFDVRQKYKDNGYTLADLKAEWQDIQTPPTTAFSLALGGLDYIVQQRKIMSKMAVWQQQNADIKIIRKPWLGHTGTIKWFNGNISSMLETEPAREYANRELLVPDSVAIAP